jgi:hypothetical protein
MRHEESLPELTKADVATHSAARQQAASRHVGGWGQLGSMLPL